MFAVLLNVDPPQMLVSALLSSVNLPCYAVRFAVVSVQMLLCSGVFSIAYFVNGCLLLKSVVANRRPGLLLLLFLDT